MQTHQFQLRISCDSNGQLALYVDDDEIVNDITAGDPVTSVVLNLEFEVADAKEFEGTVKPNTEPRVTAAA